MSLAKGVLINMFTQVRITDEVLHGVWLTDKHTLGGESAAALRFLPSATAVAAAAAVCSASCRLACSHAHSSGVY